RTASRGVYPAAFDATSRRAKPAGSEIPPPAHFLAHAQTFIFCLHAPLPCRNVEVQLYIRFQRTKLAEHRNSEGGTRSYRCRRPGSNSWREPEIGSQNLPADVVPVVRCH